MQTTRISLLARIKNASDSDAWREFDAIYRPMLHRFALARGLRSDEAEDIVQQCMTAVHEHIGRFDYDPARGRFKGWLRTLVNNRFRNLLRDRHEKLAESQDFKRPDTREESPDELFDRLLMDEILKHALKQVRAEVEETTFKAFQYYVLEERPIEQVCSELSMNDNQVHKIKWRVTRKLGEHMARLKEGLD